MCHDLTGPLSDVLSLFSELFMTVGEENMTCEFDANCSFGRHLWISKGNVISWIGRLNIDRTKGVNFIYVKAKKFSMNYFSNVIWSSFAFVSEGLPFRRSDLGGLLYKRWYWWFSFWKIWSWWLFFPALSFWSDLISLPFWVFFWAFYFEASSKL